MATNSDEGIDSILRNVMYLEVEVLSKKPETSKFLGHCGAKGGHRLFRRTLDERHTIFDNNCKHSYHYLVLWNSSELI